MVKQRVSLDDPVRKLVQRELRHVSLGVSLDELGRVLARNKFALVNQTKFVTTSDLLKKVVPCDDLPAEAKSESDKKTTVSETAGGPNELETGSGMTKIGMAATTVAGLGLAALGTLMYKKSQQ